MSDGCNLRDTCLSCDETNWGFDHCPNYIAKGEALKAADTRSLGLSYRERSAEALLSREQRIHKGRAFRKAKKPREANDGRV